MCQLLSYVDIDPNTDMSIMVYCDKISALKWVSIPIAINGPHHCRIPEYYFIHEIHECIEAIHLYSTTKNFKVNQ